MRVLAVSDVSLGYGSRQIPSIVNYIGERYEAEKIIIEPDQLERPPQNTDFPGIEFVRLRGNIHPHSGQGRIEYVLNASKLIDKLKPDFLIICTTFTLPVIFKINHKPKKIIYYSLESISSYSGDLDMNKIIDDKVDFIIFPEENRARIHLQQTGTKLPFCVAYNSINSTKFDTIPIEQKNGKILYQGGLNRYTAYEYFLNKKLQNYSIDLYGMIEGHTLTEKNEMESKFLSLNHKVRYKGYIPYNELEKIRNQYLYSIVIWLPLNDNSRYACPNKFFESIHSGVPPITAPHPQCKLLCKRYNCGIVMEDFSFDSFKDAIDRAINLDEKKYANLVENCKKAVSNELNWDQQMQKVVRLIESN